MSDFVDVVEINVQSGKGGDGMMTFRREKYVPRGGPDGGDGGRGGDVILRVDPHMRTLLDFTYQSHFKATAGQPGGSTHKTGADGDARIVRVPLGTVVYEAGSGALVADLVGADDELLAARGGHGGRGNARFATSTRQAPRFAERGEPGETYTLRLEMKLLADVGLLGFPSVGKSTLISRISAARPKIAAYHFTTLQPNLGVVALSGERQMVVADLPGLIENAHQGVGLGHQFLRHAERTKVLVHLLDASGLEGRDPLSDFRILNHELACYSQQLAQLPQVVALNKIDLPDGRDYSPLYAQQLTAEGYRCLAISAATGEGLPELLEVVWEMLQTVGGPSEAETKAGEPRRFEMPLPPERELRVAQVNEGYFVVSGTAVEYLVARADLQHSEGLELLHMELERRLVIEALEKAGVQAGDTVRIGELEFDYQTYY
jgi:GTP-binding protein